MVFPPFCLSLSLSLSLCLCLCLCLCLSIADPIQFFFAKYTVRMWIINKDGKQGINVTGKCSEQAPYRDVKEQAVFIRL
jgi:hypothetical protein